MEKNELIAWENKCIQEEPPECTSACPIHLDARLFLKEIRKGDWDAAFKVLNKTMPFPRILGRICDHPCEERCKRGAVGGPIAIGALERFCVEGQAGKRRIRPLPRKDHRIAVLGAGLAGVTAGLELLRKGFLVTLYLAEDRLGGSLWDLPERLLPREIIVDELAVLETLKAVIHAGTRLDRALFDKVCAEFEAVIIDRESLFGIDLSLPLDGDGLVAIDPATGATEREGVFAGGGTRHRGAFSPVMETLEGKKPALSVERLMQKVGLGFGRENEGPCATRLFTSLEEIATEPRVAPLDGEKGYALDEALSEAGRCIQCECMECVKKCLYLERYRGYPKKYAREIFNNERILLGAAHHYNQFTNSCTTCGLCETVCPNDFHVGELCLEARRTMLRLKIMPPSFHEFALDDMALSNGDGFALCRHQPGRTGSAWLYFPSCQLCGSSPGEVLSSYNYLGERLSGGVGILLGCCGAPAHWAGREELFRETLDRIRVSWEGMGRPRLITACVTCHTIFKEQLPETEPVSLWQCVLEAGAPTAASFVAEGGKRVAVVDPCASRHFPGERQNVRSIIASLGMSVEELPQSGDTQECCGYGGLMYNANPGLARDVMAHRGRTSGPPANGKPYSPPAGTFRTMPMADGDTVYYHTAVSGHDYLAYCAMCRDNFAFEGKRVSHLIEHLFPAVAGADPAARGWISWSERRAGRARVKAAILGGHGEGEAAEPKEYQGVKLAIAPEVMKRIDGRRILDEDIRKVIYHGETTGRRLRNGESGSYLAYLQPENVTFWVEYAPDGDVFSVLNAYCHRMRIEGVKE